MKIRGRPLGIFDDMHNFFFTYGITIKENTQLLSGYFPTSNFVKNEFLGKISLLFGF